MSEFYKIRNEVREQAAKNIAGLIFDDPALKKPNPLFVKAYAKAVSNFDDTSFFKMIEKHVRRLQRAVRRSEEAKS